MKDIKATQRIRAQMIRKSLLSRHAPDSYFAFILNQLDDELLLELADAHHEESVKNVTLKYMNESIG